MLSRPRKPYSRRDLNIARAILTGREQGKLLDEIALEFGLELDTVALVVAGADHFRDGIEQCFHAVGKVEFLANDAEHERKLAQDAQDACDEVVAIATKYIPGVDGEEPWHEWPPPEHPDDPSPETLAITVAIVHSPPHAKVMAETKSTLRTVSNTRDVAAQQVADEIERNIRPDHVCSLLIAVGPSPDEPESVVHDYVPDEDEDEE